jgi:GMP synthase (glutamine-hydrolysing)
MAIAPMACSFTQKSRRTLIDAWTTRGADQLPLPGAQSRAQQLQGHHQYGPAVEQWLDTFLHHWLAAETWATRASA